MEKFQHLPPEKMRPILALALACSVAASRAPLARAPQMRARAPRMSTDWSAVKDGADRSANLAALTALRDAGSAPLFGSFKMAGSRRISLAELSRTTRIDEKALDPSASEFSQEQIQDTFIKVIIGATIASTAWAVGSEALGVDAGFRFTGTYLLAGIPIAILAIGSTAPGILFLPVEAYRAAVASEEEKRAASLRVCKHEAGHLLCAYALGLPVQEVTVDGRGGPRVVVHDEAAVQQPGKLVSAEQIDALATVALAGLMAEADAYGKALGASEDLKLLNSMLVRTQPPIPPAQLQDKTRSAALTAWTILKKHPAAFDAIVLALERGEGLAECLRAAEAAEAESAAAGEVAAAEKAEAIARETPMERAARERAEDAARRARR